MIMLEVISPIGLPTYNNESFVFDFEYASDLLGKTIMEFLLACSILVQNAKRNTIKHLSQIFFPFHVKLNSLNFPFIIC